MLNDLHEEINHMDGTQYSMSDQLVWQLWRISNGATTSIIAPTDSLNHAIPEKEGNDLATKKWNSTSVYYIVVDSLDFGQNVQVFRIWNVSRLQYARHVSMKKSHGTIKILLFHRSSLK
jgi:hypothetical protein